MNIKKTKEEIKNTILAYLSKDEFGEYLIPITQQRPILLMGPPGIGKTAIMEQIATENKLGLVSYTITHHTRQSAIGLPFIVEREYNGQNYSITEYTMSEIIASVYDNIERTGIMEGILFIDEINSVSETLTPTMLQFLQQKRFGQHQIPKGWIIIAAGNPPEYNKSAKEFDVVTLDRVKRIDVEASFNAWKEFAYKNLIHNGIISYLNLKNNHFYFIETTVDGKQFATARGWEDLSSIIHLYEKMNVPIHENLILQYIQHKKIAKDFYLYFDLYNKYKNDYNIEEILQGVIDPIIVSRLNKASFDERLTFISLLLGRTFDYMYIANENDNLVNSLYKVLKDLKESMFNKRNQNKNPLDLIQDSIDNQLKITQMNSMKFTGERELQKKNQKVIEKLEKYKQNILDTHDLTNERAFEKIKEQFDHDINTRKESILRTNQALNNAFSFMEHTFGESQEMVLLVTDLTMNEHSVKYIAANGCEMYFKYNRVLLANERQREIIRKIENIEELLKEI